MVLRQNFLNSYITAYMLGYINLVQQKYYFKYTTEGAKRNFFNFFNCLFIIFEISLGLSKYE